MTPETRAALPFLLLAAAAAALTWTPNLLHWPVLRRWLAFACEVCAGGLGFWRGWQAHTAGQRREWEQQLEQLYRQENARARRGRKGSR